MSYKKLVKEEFDKTVKYNEKISKNSEIFNQLININDKECLNDIRKYNGDSKKLIRAATADKYTQKYLKQNVNIYTAEKAFKLDLDGSFNCKYSRNGSHLLLYSKEGSISSFNTQKLTVDFEIKKLENKIQTATFLHSNKYIAVAHKNLFIYNNNGQELHCVRDIKNIDYMEFLPHHFLLANDTGKSLIYMDTSIGEIIGNVKLEGKSAGIASFDGLICAGQRSGVITLYAPKQEKFLMKIKAHKNLVDLKTSHDKLFVLTADRKLKTFDLRNYFEPINTQKVPFNSALEISQKEVVAISSYKKISFIKNNELLQEFNTENTINSFKFTPFEDILTITHGSKLENIIVPNSSDRIYESNEISPFTTQKERQEKEVKSLLEKIPAEMISYNSQAIGRIQEDKKVKPIFHKRFYEK
ncbi:hypothetical protein NUSPORA_00297 [Nucleospora cyclopteri]